MNWSSVKNLLIAILVAANLFLVFNIVRQDRTRAYISESELHDAIELLDARGYSVSADTVPMKKFKAPVFESRYGDEYYTDVAEALAASEREMLFTLPSGGISISTKNGAWMEFDNEFDFRYSAFDNPNTAAYTEITADTFAGKSGSEGTLGTAKMKSLSSSATNFLCKLQDSDSELSAKITGGFIGSDGYTYILAEQYLGEYKVYSHYAVCVFEGDKLIFAHGRWYFSKTNEDYSTELCDQINILFSDMATLKSMSASAYTAEDDGEAVSGAPNTSADAQEIKLSAVSAITPCYAVYWNSNKTALYFIPAWQIDHIDSLTIVYNATNATVYSSTK